MNAVVYYSNTEQSKRVAKYLADIAAFESYDIYDLTEYVFNSVILVFPVHCQSVPDTVKEFLSRLHAKNLIVVATYGRMCSGNVLHYVQNHYSHNIVAAAYVPTKHSYLDENGFDDFEKLNVIVKKLNNPAPIKLPRMYRNPLSNLCKGLRSRLGVRIVKHGNCDNCGQCGVICKNQAIKKGRTNRNCIRCLRCVEKCPRKALHYKLSLPMRVYLQKKKCDDLIIYV